MRKSLILMLISISTLMSGQLASEVSKMDSLYGVAVQISDDPATGFERIAVHKQLEWNGESRWITDTWNVYSYKNGQEVDVQAVRSPYTRHLKINRFSYIDSTGASVSDTIPGAVSEYLYFFDLINSGANLIQVIKANAIKADAAGKFD